MNDWQPIETAPRDGTLIELTYMKDGKAQDKVVMKWDNECPSKSFPDLPPCWVSASDVFIWIDESGCGPTHWRHFVQ